ncbi:MAG: folC [Xanthomonadaceae bacterium]|nr:folC [Xanthomonadaceae bacterium]
MTSRSLADWLAYIEQQHPRSIELGLDRVRAVAQRMELGRPAHRVITVAGTNGKGSTIAFIEAIARAAGWRVGAYTSPHVLSYNERLRIDGSDANDADLGAGFEAVESSRGDVALTYFEFGTLAALWLMQRAGLDLALLEVGLGGRLDAVNLIDADVAVVTTVDLDHQDWLGNDRETIGFEKAGIARAEKPLVVGDDDPPASVLSRAYAIGAPAIRAGCDFFFEQTSSDSWRWRELDYSLDLPLPGLAAPVQLRNAAIAIAALRALGEDIPRAALADGVAHATISARLQRFELDGVDVWVDVAHNPQAAQALSGWLRKTPVSGMTLAVFAALGDKDIAGLVTALEADVDRWFLAALQTAGPRALSLADFRQQVQDTAAAQAEPFDTVSEAIQAARQCAQRGDRLLVFGSFHTAAAALRLLQAVG